MAGKSSDIRPRRKSPGNRVEFVLSGVLPGETKIKEAPEARESQGEPAADTEERARWIAEAAYYRAERRGFTDGFELEDWVAAESDYEADRARGARRANDLAN